MVRSINTTRKERVQNGRMREKGGKGVGGVGGFGLVRKIRERRGVRELERVSK